MKEKKLKSIQGQETMFLESNSCIEILQDRAAMLKAVRQFFDERGVLEVDTPMLSPYPPIDAHIDILSTETLKEKLGYFHSSPEYGMKKLLAKGLGDIFQLSHVFRKGEVGNIHQIEFMMIEWYRQNFSFQKLIDETKNLIFLFLGSMPYEMIKYENVFKKTFKIDPFTISLEDLNALCKKQGLCSPSDDRDTLLGFLWNIAEEDLGFDRLTCVTHFPASQAALSQTFKENQREYAARFEFYCEGIELANGYHELTDSIEQKKRLMIENKKRESLGKEKLPLDEKFLLALENLGDKEFFGVAVGFDRLMMIRHQKDGIEDILPLGWSEM